MHVFVGFITLATLLFVSGYLYYVLYLGLELLLGWLVSMGALKQLVALALYDFYCASLLYQPLER